MGKSKLGNILAITAGVLVGVACMLISYYRLKVPQIPLDWVALAFSGLIAGLLTFFIVWGHFQKDPVPLTPHVCPVCGGSVTVRPVGETPKGIMFALLGHLPLGEELECTKCHWKNTDVALNRQLQRHEKMLEKEKNKGSVA